MSKMLLVKIFALASFMVAVSAPTILAQEVLLDYDMSQAPHLQGFEYSNSSCGVDYPNDSIWNATGSLLQYRGCGDGSSGASWAELTGIFTGISTVQVDARMRILDAWGYAFEFPIHNGSAGLYTQISLEDFGDNEFHNVTIFIDFENNTSSTFLDGNPYNFNTFSWSSHSRFTMGDGNGSGTWGDVDFESIVLTGNLTEPLPAEGSSWGTLKSYYR